MKVTIKTTHYDLPWKPVFSKRPRILLVDIETAPILGWVWSLWNNNVSLNQVDSDWFVLSWSAKWIGSGEVMFASQEGQPDVENDRELLKPLAKLLDKADIVIAHNGKKFDVRKLNARFLINKIKQPSPYKVIDTMLQARRRFSFTSNKLEYLTTKLNKYFKKKVGARKYVGFDMWKAVMQQNPEAWQEMHEYNDYDVLSMEELYMTLRGWDTQHPNVAVYNDKEERVCPICGGTHLQRRGRYRTDTGEYTRYKCMSSSCGAWSRTRYTENTIKKRKALLRPAGYV